MSDDRYRKIERSKPRDPPVVAPKGRRLPFGIDRLFLRKRRAYLALIVFFAIGAAIGGYLGSPSTNDSTAANKSAPNDKRRPQHSQVSQALKPMSELRCMPIRHLLPRTGHQSDKRQKRAPQIPIGCRKSRHQGQNLPLWQKRQSHGSRQNRMRPQSHILQSSLMILASTRNERGKQSR